MIILNKSGSKTGCFAFFVVFLLFVFSLLTCIPPIDEKIVIGAEDEISPIITIISPIDGSSYQSVVSFEGIVTDDAVRNGDGKGIIRSISYQVANDVFRKGKINISSSGDTEIDESFGSGIITWDHTTATFLFELSTINPNMLKGLLMVNIEVVDNNDNSSEIRISLFESEGPIIVLEEPGNTQTAYIEGITHIDIYGTLSNSVFDLDSASEIKLLEWKETASYNWKGTLDLTEGSADYDDNNMIYSSLNENITNPEEFTFDPATRIFDTGFFVPWGAGTSIPLKITATDHNNHVTIIEVTIYEDVAGPQLSITQPSPDIGVLKYYSPDYYSPPTIIGYIFDYNTVTEMYYNVSIIPSFTPDTVTLDIGTHPGFSTFNSDGNFSFTLDDPTVSLSGQSGMATVIITAMKNNGHPTSVELYFNEDSTDPVISNVSIESDNAENQYAMPGDNIIVTFTATDADSKINPSTLKVSIEGNPQVDALPVINDNYEAIDTISGGTDCEVSIQIDAADNVGNSTSTVNIDTGSVMYYVSGPVLDPVSIESIPPAPAGWVNAVDNQVMVSFTSNQHLLQNPDITILGHTANVVKTGDYTYEATAAMQAGDSGVNPDILVTFNITNIQNAAGGTSGAVNISTDASSVTFDEKAPDPPSIPDLAAADDSGSSTIDNITNKTSGLTFTGTAEANADIEIFADTVSEGTTTADGSGNWSCDIALSAGDYDITAEATDVAGNTSSASTALLITIDTTPPAAPGQPDLDSADDTGSSSSDNITSSTTGLTFSGTAEANIIVEIFADGSLEGQTIADGSGNWSCDITLSAGDYDITAEAIDLAGNSSSASTALSITIDTSCNTPSEPDLDSGDDTGSSSSDDITNKTSGLTFSGTAEVNADIEIFADTISEGTTTADGSGNWSCDIALSAGDYDITAEATDTAGNTSSASTALPITIDTSPPATPGQPDLDSGDDTGSSSSDDITNKTSGLSFTGTAEANADIEVFADGSLEGTTTADGSGNWSCDIALSAGDYDITAEATDVAGNTSIASTALQITIDISPPAAPGQPDLDSGDDTGSSSSDNITSSTTGLTFSGTAEANITVEIFADGGLEGQTTADGSGDWSCDIALTAGDYDITAEATDLAGNSSSVSTALSITIDTTCDPPSEPDLDSGDDTGISGSDNITNATTGLTFSGTAEANVTVQIFADGGLEGQTTADGSGDWSCDIDLTAGDYDITAQATDVAGNASSASTALPVTIDTTCDPPSLPDLATADDSGTSSTDNITYVTSNLTFSGTAEANSTVEIFADAASEGQTTADGTGAWSRNTNISAGSYDITAVATDVAGNTSSASTALPIIIDTTNPSAADAELISGEIVDVVFSESVVQSEAETTSNYQLNGLVEPDSASYTGGTYTVRLTFYGQTITNGDDIEISGNAIHDIAGNVRSLAETENID